MPQRVCYRCGYVAATLFAVLAAVPATWAFAEDSEPVSVTSHVKKVWEYRDLGAPAGVVYDSAHKELFVAQIGGEGDKKDGDGVISRFDIKGQLLELSWIEGLDAPKGLAISGQSLWCTDIDSIVEVDLGTAKTRRRVAIDGAKFLTGITVDANGALYAGDMLTSRIYRIAQGRVTVFAEGRELESPGALVFDSGRLIVAGWGYTTDYTTTEAGSIFAVDLKSRQKSAFASTARGNWLGLCSDGDSGFWASDFGTGAVYSIDDAGRSTKELQLPPGIAGLVSVPEQKLLVVSNTRENRVVGYVVTNATDPLTNAERK